VVVNGFPDNLIVTGIGCMTELDTSEIIMNNVVMAPEESDFPKMHLAVVENDNHMESPYHYHHDHDQLSIAFVNPYSPKEFNEDVQFIMEVDGPAEFIAGGTIGCEGNKRVSARLLDNNGEVTLQLQDTSASFKVWAGWATGHSAVKLTPNLLLEPHDVGGEEEKPPPPKEGTKPEEKKLQEEEEIKNKDRVADEMSKMKSKDRTTEESDKKIKPKGSLPKDDSKATKEEERKMAHKKQKDKKRDKKPKEKGDDMITGRNKNRETAKKLVAERRKTDIKAESDGSAADFREDGATKDEEELEPLKHRTSILNKGLDAEQKELEAEMKQNFGKDGIKSFRGRYQSDDFANRLDMSSYFYACAFFIFSIGSILISLGKRREKGRRDL
jgi:hypothetical protein